MKQRKEALENLVSEYKKFRLSSKDSDISEQTIRSWTHDFLTIFGWDTKETSSINQEKQLLKKEKEKLKEINSTSNRPDYKLLVDGKAITFLDTKNIDVDISQSKKSAFQIKSYGWSISAPCAFITNFDEFAIYDTTYKPDISQEANFGRIYLKIDEYIERFEILDEHLYKGNMNSGLLNKLYSDDSDMRQKIPKISTDIAFAENLSSFRLSLGNAILLNNAKMVNDNIELLSYLVQMIINRIVFIRVCEARDIEKDGLLLDFQEKGFWKTFRHSSYNDFFEHYDGPLFDRDSRLDKIIIPDEIFDELLQLFYYPSPYKFDVIPTTLFSNIYEIFLAKRLEFENNKLVEKIKQEYSKTNGVVSTPQYLVQDLIKRTIVKPDLLKCGIKEIFEIKILDFACGSGAFIVEIFDYLQSIILEKYMAGENKYYQDCFHLDKDKIALTIVGKRKLISNCIHGIDIDVEAVEVARMSLALKVIDDLHEHEDYKSLGVYGYQILNKIGENIEYGNTLVSTDIFKRYPKIKNKKNIQQYSLLNCFDWGEDGFEDVFNKRSGFDYIIGNPPYVEAKHMTKDMPIMHQYLKETYQSAKKGKIDLLIPFIERGITLLNENGRMGVVIQNRFFKSEYGEGIRNFTTTNKVLSEVITFNATNIFKDRITYISSMIFDRQEVGTIYYKIINDDIYGLPARLKSIPSSREYKDGFEVIGSSSIGSGPWMFESPELLAMLDELKKYNKPFGEYAKIRVGIQVLWTKAYHIKVLDIDDEKGILKGKSGLDENIEIEIEACRPLVPNERFYSFRKDVYDTYAIFPYDIIDGEKEAILFDDFCKRFPLAGKYLKKHKANIKRNITQVNRNHQKWHLYTRESHLEENYSKILIPMTANDLYASVTTSDYYYCDNSNVNYADIPEKTNNNLYAVAAIFNSTIFSVLARAIANKQQNGYFKLNKQYIEPVLFPVCIFENNKKIVQDLAKVGIEIETKQEGYQYMLPYQKKRAKKDLKKLWEQIDLLTAKAYRLTKSQQDYFLREGRNIDRINILDAIL